MKKLVFLLIAWTALSAQDSIPPDSSSTLKYGKTSNGNWGVLNPTLKEIMDQRDFDLYCEKNGNSIGLIEIGSATHQVTLGDKVYDLPGKWAPIPEETSRIQTAVPEHYLTVLNNARADSIKQLKKQNAFILDEAYKKLAAAKTPIIQNAEIGWMPVIMLSLATVFWLLFTFYKSYHDNHSGAPSGINA